jgi:hypothetical protein
MVFMRRENIFGEGRVEANLIENTEIPVICRLSDTTWPAMSFSGCYLGLRHKINCNRQFMIFTTKYYFDIVPFLLCIFYNRPLHLYRYIDYLGIILNARNERKFETNNSSL